MQKIRNLIESSENNKNTTSSKYKQAVKYFDVAYERFVNLIKKPVRVSSKVQRQAQLQKALWQKKMREKYKIKDR